MSTYQLGHLAAMWAFYALGCLAVVILLVAALAWCWDRWSRRGALEDLDAHREIRAEFRQPRHSQFTRHRLNF
jgi:uncharacterized membrane protein YeiB